MLDVRTTGKSSFTDFPKCLQPMITIATKKGTGGQQPGEAGTWNNLEETSALSKIILQGEGV